MKSMYNEMIRHARLFPAYINTAKPQDTSVMDKFYAPKLPLMMV
jgi:hypothetical protein